MDSFLKHGGKPPKTPGEDEVTVTGSHLPETQTTGALAGITSVIREGDGKTSEAMDKALGGTASAVPEKPFSKAQKRGWGKPKGKRSGNLSWSLVKLNKKLQQ